jgi:hypothetical protein
MSWECGSVSKPVIAEASVSKHHVGQSQHSLDRHHPDSGATFMRFHKAFPGLAALMLI